MTSATEAVLKDALRLKPVERAELIDGLFHSFDRAKDGRIDALWAEEAESRIDAYEAGELGSDSAEAVFARINQR